MRIFGLVIFMLFISFLYLDNYKKYDKYEDYVLNNVNYVKSDYAYYDDKVYCASNDDIISNHSDSIISFVNDSDDLVRYNLGMRVSSSSNISLTDVKYLLDGNVNDILSRVVSEDDEYIYFNLDSFVLDGYEESYVNFVLFVDSSVDYDLSDKYLDYNMYIY